MPAPQADESNPWLTEDGQLNPGLIQETIPHRGWKRFYAMVDYWDDFLEELDDLPSWAVDRVSD